jgi:uncharacterized protein (TIGR02145 family)
MNNQFFKTCQIGNQIWMAENLNLDCFQNGTLIQEAKSIGEWRDATKEARPVWCYYNYNADYAEIFGRLYNGFAIRDPKGIAPKGWHLPTKKEWWELIQFLGGSNSRSSSKLRLNIHECKKIGIPIEWAGTNNFGFSALPGSFSCSDGLFFDGGIAFSDDWQFQLDTSFWSSEWRESVEGSHSTSTPVIGIHNLGGSICGNNSEGRYIRCIDSHQKNPRKTRALYSTPARSSRDFASFFGFSLQPHFSFSIFKFSIQENSFYFSKKAVKNLASASFSPCW